MNKDIRKYIANCILCQREKAKVQHYPLHMMEIPDRPFDKIVIDLITECETSTYNRPSNLMARSIPYT